MCRYHRAFNTSKALKNKQQIIKKTVRENTDRGHYYKGSKKYIIGVTTAKGWPQALHDARKKNRHEISYTVIILIKPKKEGILKDVDIKPA